MSRTSLLALGTGLALGLVPSVALPGARALLPPLLVLPLFVLAWAGAGFVVERLAGLRSGFVTRLALGAGALHTLILLAGLAGWYRPWPARSLLVLLALAGAWSIWKARPTLPGEGAAAAACWGALGLVAGLMTLVLVVPPIDPDGMTYHLALPDAWAGAGRFVHIPTLHYSYMPLGAEQGFLVARLLLPAADPFPAWTLACGVSLLYGLLLAAAASTLLSGGDARARPLAALLVFALPVTLLASGLPYNDALLAAFLLLALAEGLAWAERPDPRRSVVAGLLFGFALGVKYTALLAAPALLPAVALAARGLRRKDWARGLALAGAAALLVWSPWFLKTWAATGNPVYPAAHSVLGGAPGGFEAWDVAAAAENAKTAGHGAGLHPLRWLTAPLDLLGDPEDFGVLPRVGPSLLLALPFLAWALWARGARRERALALAAILLYLVWSLTARNARYLLPCLAIALAITAWGAMRYVRSRERGPRADRIFRAAVAAMLVLLLVVTDLSLAGRVFQGLLKPQDLYEDLVTPHDYVVSRRPAAACLLWASRNLPADASVLMVGETRALYLGRPSLVAGALDPSPLLWLERKTGSEGFREAVRASGATHLLFSTGMLELARDHDRYRGREAEAAALLKWADAEGEQGWICGPAALYRLPAD